jgi:vancomycin resistance protein VanW
MSLQRLRLLLPPELRRWLKQALRVARDVSSGRHFRLARPRAQMPADADFPFRLTLTQPVRQTAGAAGKCDNIRLAAENLQRCVLEPGRIFSFWTVVGRPDGDRGFRKGRNLVRGELQEEYGGGLCQLASILYHLGLMAGLTVLERHNHSVDLYHDSERYTPLGADAAVAYGYKDLRLQNPHDCVLCFRIRVTADAVTAELLSTAPIAPVELSFRWQALERGVEVSTLRRGAGEGEELLAVSRYRHPA